MKNHRLLLLVLIALFCQLAGAQDSLPTPASFFKTIEQLTEELPLIHVRTDWRQLVNDKLKEEYQTGAMHWVNEAGDTLQLSLRVRARGNMRKKVCNYPPLQFKFKKEELHEMGLDSSFNDVKVVLQCRNGEVGNLYLLREYLIYKMYETIGPIHYKTRLVRLAMEEGEGKPAEEVFAFLIEKEDEFETRFDGNVIEEGVIRNSIIDRQAYTRMCFFQYLILNNDWSVNAKHNMEFIKLKDVTKIYPVPYDFDYSGWVMTNYAVPPPQLPIKHVSDAYFRGQQLTEEEVLATARFFIERKDDLYATCSRFTLLNEREQRRMAGMLDDFYRTVENEKFLIRNFANLR